MSALSRRPQPAARELSGFTLLELLAAITIAGMLLAAAVPASVRFYQSIQYRQAVREVITVLASARYAAVNSGRAQDVAVNPGTRQISFREQVTQLPEKLNVVVHSAREINRRDEGVIRFYPEGGSSGGDIELERPDADGIRVSVDWLDGRVTHARYALD